MPASEHCRVCGGWHAFPPVCEPRPKPPLGDPVSSPAHYTAHSIEVIDFLDDWFSDRPLEWQVVKYVSRAPHKGNELQDLKKARYYLERRIKSLETQPPA